MAKINCSVYDCEHRSENDCTLESIKIEEASKYDSTPKCKSYKLKAGIYSKCSKCGSREFFCGCI